MSKFIIQTSQGLVAGYCARNQIVSLTTDNTRAKRFPSLDKARIFVDRYADAGYGLRAYDAQIVKVEE